jgi:hypothetical protein
VPYTPSFVLDKFTIIQDKERNNRLITLELSDPTEQITPHNLRSIVYQASELRRVLPALCIPEEVEEYLHSFIKGASALV